MVVVEQQKKYCFSEGEFSILADACGVRSMLCFRVAGGGQLRMLSRAEYNKTVYELCKRGILEREEEILVLKKEIDSMIALCRNCEWVVCFNDRTEHICNACLYISKAPEGAVLSERGFTLILPGCRKREYIRISSHEGVEVDDIAESYLKDSNEVGIYDGKSLLEKAVIGEKTISVELIKRYLK